jgi:capsular exopolysaccharide synthesis family protein
MSKFAKALEQAQRERAMRNQGAPAPAPFVPPPPAAPPTRKVPAPSRGHAVPTGEVDDHLVSLVAPASLEAEQYRALRHQIEQRHKTDNLSVIAVSSPGVGDGKSITAANLAGALAQASDASVLLVEADLRRPSIGTLLGFDDPHGLGLVDAILDSDVSLADVILPRSPFNLNVVLAGQTPPSPYEVLKSPRLGALLDEARRHYDFIILDTPPLAPVQDCRVVARWVDGILLVIAAGQTPRALLDAALDVLDPAKVIGLVFNGYDQLLAGRYASHYSRYALTPAGPRGGRLGRMTRRVGSLLRRGQSREAKRPRRRRDAR